MEQIAHYIEKLGYTVEEQSNGIAKYLVIFKDSQPLGFIQPDLSVSLVDKSHEPILSAVIAFIKENENGLIIKGREYLIASYMGCQLTTFFDVDISKPSYVAYVPEKTGEVAPHRYMDRYEALCNFAVKSGMLDADQVHIKKKGGISIFERINDNLLNYLLSKRDARA